MVVELRKTRGTCYTNWFREGDSLMMHALEVAVASSCQQSDCKVQKRALSVLESGILRLAFVLLEDPRDRQHCSPEVLSRIASNPTW